MEFNIENISLELRRPRTFRQIKILEIHENIEDFHPCYKKVSFESVFPRVFNWDVQIYLYVVRSQLYTLRKTDLFSPLV